MPHGTSLHTAQKNWMPHPLFLYCMQVPRLEIWVSDLGPLDFKNHFRAYRRKWVSLVETIGMIQSCWQRRSWYISQVMSVFGCGFWCGKSGEWSRKRRRLYPVRWQVSTSTAIGCKYTSLVDSMDVLVIYAETFRLQFEVWFKDARTKYMWETQCCLPIFEQGPLESTATTHGLLSCWIGTKTYFRYWKTYFWRTLDKMGHKFHTSTAWYFRFPTMRWCYLRESSVLSWQILPRPCRFMSFSFTLSDYLQWQKWIGSSEYR